MPHPGHAALGDFLRSRRERLAPEACGLPAARRRRTPGLRREEVAERAGIGVDWYIRLEQGRAVTPSATTIDALARALRLTPVEHAHLRALATIPRRRAFTAETVPPAIRQLVETLNLPAYVTGRRWDVLAWNRAAADIFGFDRLPDGERNILLHVLTNPASRAFFGAAWAQEARRIVAQFRATHDLWAGDPAFIELLARLHAGCPEFPAWWNSHDIAVTTAGRKTLIPPGKPALHLAYATFQSNDDPALKLIIYTPG